MPSAGERFDFVKGEKICFANGEKLPLVKGKVWLTPREMFHFVKEKYSPEGEEKYDLRSEKYAFGR